MSPIRAGDGGRLARAFALARAQGRCAFIPYITAGDPDLTRTRSIARALADAGADLLEIGVPFSDPIADGPVNQRASERALQRGVTLRSCLELAGHLREDGTPPVILFTYYNPIHRMGLESFARAAATAGVDGVLVTDLPPEEADDLKSVLLPQGVDLIFLLSPTSSNERLEMVGRQASGFLYFISRTGVTGAREDLPPELAGQVRAARQVSSLPIAVGFGISRPEQVRSIATFADGVVVGSALMALIEENAAGPDLEERIQDFCRRLQAPLRIDSHGEN
jgi:tryptophan synthase alpha chain